MKRVPTLTLVVLLVAAGAGTALASDGDYSIQLTPTVDTPDREAELGSETFPVTAVGRVDPGETVTAEITAPDRDYEVVVYETHRREVASRSVSGDATVQFDTTGWEPGSYLVAVEAAGDVVAIHPFVVSAYRLDVSAPFEAEPDSTVRVTADVAPIGEADPGTRVAVLVAGEGGERRATLDRDGDGRYSATLTLAGLPAGDYSIYVVVQGSKVQFGERETVAFTAGLPLRIGPTTSTTGGADVPTETPDGTDATVTSEGTTVGSAATDVTTAAAANAASTPEPDTGSDGQNRETAALSFWIAVPVVIAGALLLLVGNRLR